MITLCTTIAIYDRRYPQGSGHFQDEEDILLDSIGRFTTGISEIIVSFAGNPKNDPHTWEQIVNRRHVKNVGNVPVKRIWDCTCPHLHQAHPWGLHNAINHSTNEYVLLCDPDVFFYTDVPKFFHDLMTTMDLNVVGVSHYTHQIRAEGAFPSVLCSLWKKSSLPRPEWMAGRLIAYDQGLQSGHPQYTNWPGMRADGKYLVHGAIPEIVEKYPRPGGLYDVGNKLWYWNYEQNGKWLSFLPHEDWQTFSTEKFDSNFDLNREFPQQKLLFHKGMNAPNSLIVQRYREHILPVG